MPTDNQERGSVYSPETRTGDHKIFENAMFSLGAVVFTVASFASPPDGDPKWLMLPGTALLSVALLTYNMRERVASFVREVNVRIVAIIAFMVLSVLVGLYTVEYSEETLPLTAAIVCSFAGVIYIVERGARK